MTTNSEALNPSANIFRVVDTKSGKTSTVVRVKAETEINVGDVLDLLFTALAGGSSYWYGDLRVCTEAPADCDCGENWKHDNLDGGASRIYRAAWGGLVELFDMEDGHKRYTLTKDRLTEGLQIMAQKHLRHWADFINEAGDARTGDVFLQCCLFGGIMYG